MTDLNQCVTRSITEIVRGLGCATTYRTPLVGFAQTRDPLFERLKTLIDPSHLLPSDLLPTAKSVVSFFLPFSEDLVRKNQQGPAVTRDWALAKMETDQSIHAVIQGMKERLAPMGIACSGDPALEPYDATRFMHPWSQRHMAYICGLGNFGLNHLIITRLGCAGRLGSFCLDVETRPDPACTAQVCLYKIDGSCGVCVQKCPAGALGYGTLDKSACSAWINDGTEKLFKGDRSFRSCGKCIALPCAWKRPEPSTR
jgi:epoxyqueuosine reductase